MHYRYYRFRLFVPRTLVTGLLVTDNRRQSVYECDVSARAGNRTAANDAMRSNVLFYMLLFCIACRFVHNAPRAQTDNANTSDGLSDFSKISQTRQSSPARARHDNNVVRTTHRYMTAKRNAKKLRFL